MSKQYPQKTGEYVLPNSAYYRTLYLIKDLPRMELQLEDLLLGTPSPTETPEIQRQRNITAAESTSLKYATIMKDVRDIDAALTEAVPTDLQLAILESITKDKPYPIRKHARTYGRYKQKFIYTLAKRKGYI